MTSRLRLDGGDLYGHIVVAQPPWQFFYGAGADPGDPRLADLPAARRGARPGGCGRAGRDRGLASHGEPLGRGGGSGTMPADAVGRTRARCTTPELLAPPVLLGVTCWPGNARRPSAALCRGGAVHQVAMRARADRDGGVLGGAGAFVGAAIAVVMTAVASRRSSGSASGTTERARAALHRPPRARHARGDLGPGVLECDRARRTGGPGLALSDPRRPAARGADRAGGGDAGDADLDHEGRHEPQRPRPGRGRAAPARPGGRRRR